MATILAAPDFARKLLRVRERALAEGIEVVFVQGYRSDAYQQGLLDCWNDPADGYACRKRRGIVYRPAPAGSSTHNYARGADCVAVPIPGRCNLSPEGAQRRLGEIAEEEGLRWGGTFTKVVNGRRVPDPDPKHIDDGRRFALPDGRPDLAEMKARFDEAALVPIS